MMRELNFKNYNQHQLNAISPELVSVAATKIGCAGKFNYNGQNWEPVPYKGYAVVSMLNNHPVNAPLTDLFTAIQQELIYQLRPLNAFYMLPPDSFHQTVANTLSAENYTDNILARGLDDDYPGIISHAFAQMASMARANPIRMRLIGVAILGSAIVVLGTFDHESDHQRVLNFRNEFYDQGQIEALNIKRTRPFIGHITLAYAEQKLNKNQKEHLAGTINELNEDFRGVKRYFHMANAELRSYNNLAAFNREEHFPVYQFSL